MGEGTAPYKALWDPRETGRCDRLSSCLLGILPKSFTVFTVSISQFVVMLTYVGLVLQGIEILSN